MHVRRHRYFEANWPLKGPRFGCYHAILEPRYRSLDQRRKRRKPSRFVTVYGQGTHQVPLSRVIGVHGEPNYAGELDMRKWAMGIDWMTNEELSQAIPPAYTEVIGRQLMEHLSA
jgi:DNA (cytosine-5)-methyltransferase 1